MHGARLAALVGISVTFLSVLIGVVVGTVAGYRGGYSDHVATAVLDVVQAFPATILHIAIVSLTADPNVATLVFALAATGWVIYARIARAQALSLREQPFVDAARVLGLSQVRILVRHLMPNLAGPIIVQASGGFAVTILAEATLSFLGLGPSRGVSWGALLEQGTSVLLRFPHVSLAAGFAMSLTVLGFNLAGDWLRDRLDPRYAAQEV